MSKRQELDRRVGGLVRQEKGIEGASHWQERCRGKRKAGNWGGTLKKCSLMEVGGWREVRSGLSRGGEGSAGQRLLEECGLVTEVRG